MLEDHSEEEELWDKAKADAWNAKMEKKVMETKNRELKVKETD